MLQIKYFRSYSESAKQLEAILSTELVPFLKNDLNIDASFETFDSKGLSRKDGNTPWQVLTAAFNNSIVIIDGSVEEVDGLYLGVNYECITSAVSSLDNILIVSRTQLPLNFIPCRTNVAPHGEKDRINSKNNAGGYSKNYTNEQILQWLYQQLSLMKDYGRIPRPKNLLIDVESLSANEILEAEKYVMGENMTAIKAERQQKKSIFISYRTKYFFDVNNPDAETLKRSRYKGQYNINDVVNVIRNYHIEQGDVEEWGDPIFYPKGILSNEFMPENRRWAFVSIPDRRIRECDEFWIFDTIQKIDSDGHVEEVGYWDSWWCLGEFLTLVRMNYLGQLKEDFKIMVFSPDKEVKITELPHNSLPKMTDAQNREIARYFANGDFLEAGLESMANMRRKRYWPKFCRKLYFNFMKKFVWPMIFGEFTDYPFEYFEESVKSHVYDKSFLENRILEWTPSQIEGMTMEKILQDENFVWNFLNINGYYTGLIPNLKEKSNVININLNDKNLKKILSKGECEMFINGNRPVKIRKSKDKFYIFWQPRNGKLMGPNKCIIEVVDIYELN